MFEVTLMRFFLLLISFMAALQYNLDVRVGLHSSRRFFCSNFFACTWGLVNSGCFVLLIQFVKSRAFLIAFRKLINKNVYNLPTFSKCSCGVVSYLQLYHR